MTWLVVVGGLLLLVFLHELGHFSRRAARRRASAELLRRLPAGGLQGAAQGHRVRHRRDPARRDGAHPRHEPPCGPRRRGVHALPRCARTRRCCRSCSACAARSTPRTSQARAAALPELHAEVERAQLSPAARRSANRALRELDEGTGPDAYWRQATWRRIAIIAAGPAANILVAFIIFFVVFMTGAPSQTPTTKVGQVESNTPAAAAGLRAGDRVVAVNGRRPRRRSTASPS